MENYTKYALKAESQLRDVLADKDNLFLLACGKCFKEFDTLQESEAEAVAAIAKEMGKTVTGIAKADFLCNKTKAENKLSAMVPAGTEHIAVISCGLGIQTIADVATLPVVAATDSVGGRGHHGMALTEKKCEACAQCYLNITGGICPIVDCAKSLINGQCGGAKNGKCEVDPNKDCAWEKIQARLESQGRTQELTAQSIQLRDWSKVNHKVIGDYVRAVRESRFAGYYGGVHPSEKKEFSQHTGLVALEAPDVLVFPMSMHLGAPANPVVQVGDTVKKGQLLGEASGFISAPVHSSVSGKVIAVEERPHATRGTCLSVVVENDRKYTLHESVQPHGDLEALNTQQIVEIVKNAGIVGMGGAGFPTYVKLQPGKPIEYVLLNGCECEPYLTADHQLLLNFADEVIFGLQAMMRAVDAPKGVIVIEDNKPDAIALLQEKVAQLPGILVCIAKTKYPQGAEKMLIKRVTGRMVPSGALPADVGCVVSNVSTTKAVADAIRTGMPLIERVTSVTGEYMKNPGNFIVPIGTSAAHLVDLCGGITREDATVKAGGPMMGFVQSTLDTPIMKGSNGIIAIAPDPTVQQECIKCGRCVDVCPMELKPLLFAKFSKLEHWQGFKDEKVMDCMECRCCQYICPAKIDFIGYIRAGKGKVREMK